MKKRGYFMVMFALTTVYALIGFVLQDEPEVIVRFLVLLGIIITGFLTVFTKSSW